MDYHGDDMNEVFGNPVAPEKVKSLLPLTREYHAPYLLSPKIIFVSAIILGAVGLFYACHIENKAREGMERYSNKLERVVDEKQAGD